MKRKSIHRRISRLLLDQSAATAVESAVMLALIFLACVIGIAGFCHAHTALWQRTVEAMDIGGPEFESRRIIYPTATATGSRQSAGPRSTGSARVVVKDR